MLFKEILNFNTANFFEVKVVHLYLAPFPCNALYNDQFTPSRPEAYIGASGSHFKAVHVCWYSFTDPGRLESWVNFSGKEDHQNIQPSTKPRIELGTLGLGGRDLNHCANPSALVR